MCLYELVYGDGDINGIIMTVFMGSVLSIISIEILMVPTLFIVLSNGMVGFVFSKK
jgi:hypothetical protein